MRRFARSAGLFLSLAALQVSAEHPPVAPAFTLVDAGGQTVSMTPDDGRVKVVIFTSAKCAEALAFEARIVELTNKLGAKGALFYVLDGDPSKSQAGDDLFPYLSDEGNRVARAYGVVVAPSAFVIDGRGIVQYRGYIDDSADPKKRAVGGVSAAVGALLNGRDVVTRETQAFGCALE
jgi:peroxiredoxin